MHCPSSTSRQHAAPICSLPVSLPAAAPLSALTWRARRRRVPGRWPVAAALALLALSALPARLAAQTLDVFVAWTSDYTLTPNGTATSRSGAVAGPANVVVRFTAPANCVGAVVKKLVIHESANHYVDVGGGDNLNAPMTLTAPNTWDYGYHWETHAGFHNSPHTITAQVTYTVMSFFPPPPQSTQATTPDATITVTPANLLIDATTPVNPEPILWDPDTMTSKTLSATASCGYKEAQPVTLQIYTSSQALVMTLQQTPVVGPGDTSVQFTWDGSQDPPATGVAPKGVYLFRWSVGGIAQTPPTTDCDKSGALSVNQAGGLIFDGYDEPNTEVRFRIQYNLADSAQPPANASAGRVVLYDPLLAPAHTYTMVDLDRQLGDHAATVQPLNLAVPTSALAPVGGYVFLICAADSHLAQDRGHRNR